MDISSILNGSIFKNNPTGKQQISSAEVYNIWNGLRVRYISMTQYNHFLNFVHDKDFSMLLNNILDDINN